MLVSDFFALEGYFTISPKEAQDLNKKLSELSASDIPREKVDHVLDYLIAALNMDSVEMDIKPMIEKLTADLQYIKSQG